MTALAKDRKTEYREGIDIPYLVAAATEIFAGSMVAVLTSDGYARPAEQTGSPGGVLFVGVAREYVDNSEGGDGDKSVIVRIKGVFRFAAVAITQAEIGRIMYLQDDQTFNGTTTHFIVAGRLVEYVSATEGWIAIDCSPYTGLITQGYFVTIADAGEHYDATTVEAALQEIYAVKESAVQALLAATIIALDDDSIIKVVGSGGAVISTAEFPVGRKTGDRIIIQGTDDTNTVTLDNSEITNVMMAGGADATLGEGDTIEFRWSAADPVGMWLEISRSLNAAA